MAEEALLRITLAAVIGTLAAIVYCLRILVLMERRVARIEAHVDNVVSKVLKEEIKLKHMIKRQKSKKRKK